jgi:hypothetical protein
MNNMKPLRLKDLPSIDETNEKFAQKEENLKRIGCKNANELVRLKNQVAMNFISENFELLEYRDKELANRTLRKSINIGLARLTKDAIYDMHYLVRFTFRFSFYAIPIFFWTDYTFGAYAQISLYLCEKYVDRIDTYQKFKDPKVINPFIQEEQELIKNS